jgi:hypothetical protein
VLVDKCELFGGFVMNEIERVLIGPVRPQAVRGALKPRFLFGILLGGLLIGSMAACGGGDSGSGSGSPTNPLVKYNGTYSLCDQDHTIYDVSISAAGDSQATAVFQHRWYANANCTGAQIATLTFPVPDTLTYKQTSSVPVLLSTGVRQSLSLDLINQVAVAQTARLVGTGVSGSCVVYTGGRYCYTLNYPAESIDGGLALSGANIRVFELTSGVYEESGVFIRN